MANVLPGLLANRWPVVCCYHCLLHRHHKECLSHNSHRQQDCWNVQEDLNDNSYYIEFVLKITTDVCVCVFHEPKQCAQHYHFLCVE